MALVIGGKDTRKGASICDSGSRSRSGDGGATAPDVNFLRLKACFFESAGIDVSIRDVEREKVDVHGDWVVAAEDVRIAIGGGRASGKRGGADMTVRS
jgi:hypothetical protein